MCFGDFFFAVNMPQIWLTWAPTCFCLTVVVKKIQYNHRNKISLLETGLRRVKVNQWCVSSSNLKKPCSGSPGVLKGSPSVSLSTGIVQGTRGLMLASVLLSIISLLVEMVGMRCTTFMAGEPEQKDKVALAGGVIFLIAGQFSYFIKAKPCVLRAARLHSKWLWSRTACTLLTDEEMMKSLHVLTSMVQ